MAEIVEAAAGTVLVTAMVGMEEAAWTVSVMVMAGVEPAAGTVSVMVGAEPAAWAVSVMVMVGVEEETAASEMAENVGTVVAGESVASGRVAVIVVVVVGAVAVLRYCRNVRPTWVKFDSKDTKE